jgi:hypothetical protein
MEKQVLIGIQHPCKENNYCPEYRDILSIDENIVGGSDKYIRAILSLYLSAPQVTDVLNNVGNFMYGFKVTKSLDQAEIYAGTQRAGWFSNYVEDEHKVCSLYTCRYIGQVTAKSFAEKQQCKPVGKFVDELKSVMPKISCDGSPINIKEAIRQLSPQHPQN